MTSLLSTLRSATLDRHNRAVRALRDGTLTVTLTLKTEQEIRAFVTNGDGVRYGVCLTEHGAFCSCPDAMHRGAVCKHALAACISQLQHNDPLADAIHLMWTDGTVLCGERYPHRFWQHWNANALNWHDMCKACVRQWTHPARANEVHDEPF